jgi:hypothetical protein
MNFTQSGVWTIAFLALLVALLVLALVRPGRISCRDHYRWAWFSLIGALILQALPPLLLSANTLSESPIRYSQNGWPVSLTSSLGDYLRAWRAVNLAGHLLVAAGLLLTVSSVGLFRRPVRAEYIRPEDEATQA